MKRLLILVLMVLVSCGLFAQARPSFDQVAPGVGKFSDGTAAAPSITFGSDPDTGLYRYGANAIGITHGGVSGLALYDSLMAFNKDYLLCRNTADGSDSGNISLAGGGGNSPTRGAYFRLYGNEHATNPGAALIAAGSVTNGVVSFNTNNIERARISYDGNLLIGTITDDGVNKLQVNGGCAFGGHDGLSSVKISRYSSGYPYALLIAGDSDRDVAVGMNIQTRTSAGALVDNITLSGAAPGIKFGSALVPTYADNAAAIAGGLAAGDIYRTSTGVLMIRY